MPTPTKITREQVLGRAIEIVDREGAEALSMRGLAESLGAKAPSLYRYFPNKISLELAVVDQGNRKLLECLKGAAGLAALGDEWIAVGETYVAFARAKPNLYGLMMERRAGFAAGSAVGASGRELWGFLLRVTGGLEGGGAEMGSAVGNSEIGVGIGAEVGSGEVNSGDIWRAVALWFFLHGFVSLDGAGRFGASGVEDAFAADLKALRNGFQAVLRA